jgi:hypothetical protein
MWGVFLGRLPFQLCVLLLGNRGYVHVRTLDELHDVAYGKLRSYQSLEGLIPGYLHGNISRATTHTIRF